MILAAISTVLLMQSAPLRAAATRREIAVACTLARRFHAESLLPDSRRNFGPTFFGHLAWRDLPARTDCDGRATEFKPEGYGRFVTDIAVIGGGRQVALRGGVTRGELDGQGVDCLYERERDGYRLVGCRPSWIS